MKAGHCVMITWTNEAGTVVYTSPDNCTKTITWADCSSGRLVKAKMCCKVLTVKVKIDCQAVAGPEDMWWFGVDPAGNNFAPPNYAVESTFGFTRESVGTFQWSCSGEACIVSGATCTQSVSGTNLAAVSVRTRGPSAGLLSAWVRCKWTHPSGSPTVTCNHYFTVLKPAKLNRLGRQDAQCPLPPAQPIGFTSEIHYEILDQFGAVLPREVPWNEQFTTAEQSDWLNETWPWGPECGWPVNPANAYDTIQRVKLPSMWPDPEPPWGSGGAIDHRQGLWRVGTTQIGQGLAVESCPNSPILTWQIYRNHGDHTCP